MCDSTNIWGYSGEESDVSLVAALSSVGGGRFLCCNSRTNSPQREAGARLSTLARRLLFSYTTDNHVLAVSLLH